MTYTSLISSSDFSGPMADLLTAANGMLGFAFVIIALGVLFRVFSR